MTIIGIYLIGVLFALGFSIEEAKTGKDVRFKEGCFYIIGILIWPLFFGMIFRQLLNDTYKEGE